MYRNSQKIDPKLVRNNDEKQKKNFKRTSNNWFYLCYN